MASRVISQQKGVSVGAVNLDRVISVSCDADIAAAGTDVRIFGSLARLGVNYSSDIPCTVSIGWLLWDGGNESACGLGGTHMASEFIADPVLSEKTVVVSSGAEGVDGGGGSLGGLTFNNCAVSNYSATFAVGELPSAECELVGSSVIAGGGAGAAIPTASDGVFALKPQDVVVTIASSFGGDMFMSSSVFCGQSVSVDLPLARENVECLGSATPLKYVQFPITATMTVSANTQEYGSINLVTIADGTRQPFVGDVSVACASGGGSIGFSLKGASVASQSLSIGLDDAETIETVFEAQVGGADATGQGLYLT
jgi:hypothetical protein